MLPLLLILGVAFTAYALKDKSFAPDVRLRVVRTAERRDFTGVDFQARATNISAGAADLTQVERSVLQAYSQLMLSPEAVGQDSLEALAQALSFAGVARVWANAFATAGRMDIAKKIAAGIRQEA